MYYYVKEIVHIGGYQHVMWRVNPLLAVNVHGFMSVLNLFMTMVVCKVEK